MMKMMPYSAFHVPVYNSVQKFYCPKVSWKNPRWPPGKTYKYTQDSNSVRDRTVKMMLCSAFSCSCVQQCAINAVFQILYIATVSVVGRYEDTCNIQGEYS